MASLRAQRSNPVTPCRPIDASVTLGRFAALAMTERAEECSRPLIAGAPLSPACPAPELRSAIRSASFSSPIDSRTVSGPTCAAAFSCSGSCRCVVRGRVDRERFDLADVHEVRDQLQPGDERERRRLAALQREGEDRARPVRRVAPGEVLPGLPRQHRVAHPGHRRMILEESRDRPGVGAVPLHPQGQGLDAHERQERVHRRQAGAEVAQAEEPAGRRERRLPGKPSSGRGRRNPARAR